ncbi:MAG TPA: hypothetical protein DCZ04_13075, partial [Syntrophorhabdus aromaticivorans]|nr:hypothetical protein [Syntrophorhabdus aromaticivorans]
DETAEVSGVLGMSDGCADLGKLFYRIADLLVKDAPISNDDDRFENWRVVSDESDELVGKPGDGIGL